MAPNQSALEVEDLHKNFGSLEVLKGISFTAHEHDVVSILGSSGSGKSTLLRCINLLETPTSGKVTVHGETIRMRAASDGSMQAEDKRQVQRIRTRLAMVFQQFNLWSHMTVLENVCAGGVFGHGRRWGADLEDFARAQLARVGLDAFEADADARSSPASASKASRRRRSLR